MEKIRAITKFLEKNYSNFRLTYSPFQTLIACIISQRTRDENTVLATSRLFPVAKTPEKISGMPIAKLEALIRPCGFYRQKAKRIKAVSKIILEKYKGKVPDKRELLLELPGVGWKTADITLSYGHGIPAIPIDTHVNQVSKRLGLVKPKDKVEAVREKLEKIFPKSKWYVVNHGFVQFGREICKPINPLCKNNKELCPFSNFCWAYKTKRFGVR